MSSERERERDEREMRERERERHRVPKLEKQATALNVKFVGARA